MSADESPDFASEMMAGRAFVPKHAAGCVDNECDRSCMNAPAAGAVGDVAQCEAVHAPSGDRCERPPHEGTLHVRPGGRAWRTPDVDERARLAAPTPGAGDALDAEMNLERIVKDAVHMLGDAGRYADARELATVTSMMRRLRALAAPTPPGREARDVEGEALVAFCLAVGDVDLTHVNLMAGIRAALKRAADAAPLAAPVRDAAGTGAEAAVPTDAEVRQAFDQFTAARAIGASEYGAMRCALQIDRAARTPAGEGHE